LLTATVRPPKRSTTSATNGVDVRHDHSRAAVVTGSHYSVDGGYTAV
jgi:hypothetical protein